MPNISIPSIILILILAAGVLSIVFNFSKRAALKPNLAQVRHETEAEILEENEEKYKEALKNESAEKLQSKKEEN